MVALRLRRWLAAANGNDAYAAVPKRVRIVHDADGADDDASSLSATGWNNHAKMPEFRSDSADDPAYRSSSFLPSPESYLRE
jgi:hypothetical protein